LQNNVLLLPRIQFGDWDIVFSHNNNWSKGKQRFNPLSLCDVCTPLLFSGSVENVSAQSDAYLLHRLTYVPDDVCDRVHKIIDAPVRVVVVFYAPA